MKMKKVKVGITGGIGSGKSTVARYFKEKGFPVFSCDEIYKEIYETSEYQLELSDAFPECLKNGKIDKQLLAQRVFSCPESLQKLNSIAHRRIMSELYRRMDVASENVVFAEVPLLFEGGYEKAFDKVIVVLREKQQRIQAVSSRDKLSNEAIERRMSTQYDYDSVENLQTLQNQGCVFIENNFSEEHLWAELEKFLSNENL